MDFLKPLRNRNIRILGDLFHMNIEESSIPEAIAHEQWLGHVHFADSNRRAIGMGHTAIEPAIGGSSPGSDTKATCPPKSFLSRPPTTPPRKPSRVSAVSNRPDRPWNPRDRARSAIGSPPETGLAKSLHHVAMNVGQSVVPPLKSEREAFMIESEQVQNGRLQVMDVNLVLHHAEP